MKAQLSERCAKTCRDLVCIDIARKVLGLVTSSCRKLAHRHPDPCVVCSGRLLGFKHQHLCVTYSCQHDDEWTPQPNSADTRHSNTPTEAV